MAARNAMRQRELPLETDSGTMGSRRNPSGVGFLLLFFACASMFVLGVLVGRGTAPVRFDMERLQAELSALRGALDQRIAKPPEPEKKAPGGGEKAIEHTELDFYEALKESKDAARLNREVARVADLPVAPPTPPPAAETAAAKPDPAPPPEPRSPLPAPAAPAVGSNGAPGVAPAGLPAVSPAGYQLQVASLASASDADLLVKRLQARGLSAFRQQVTIPDKGVRYRVRIDGFKSRAEAASEIARLKGEKINAMLLTGGR